MSSHSAMTRSSSLWLEDEARNENSLLTTLSRLVSGSSAVSASVPKAKDAEDEDSDDAEEAAEEMHDASPAHVPTPGLSDGGEQGALDAEEEPQPEVAAEEAPLPFAAAAAAPPPPAVPQVLVPVCELDADSAAQRIQFFWRRALLSREVQYQNVVEDMMSVRAGNAITIQRHWRGLLGRRHAEQVQLEFLVQHMMRNRSEAAKEVQGWWRRLKGIQ
mmetsp:Transcript_73717/g.175518  ORF Transcript_73717/g.175518 Transcript_73717/m.175518 type:complete len:217 (+) Transcript_73717:137-787(+)|eukprot:CAMPEP_0178393188 /NCGR_PEP_ID=MMETSP0689_2-20121128/12059_1 /TAXON_ID=160604 /ORGANISM="Amphidinium massartii, Strain CS-259" /LENGTH=216 /DNA_ID=CAMNT_0020013773 /DNA_START=63 /DNA_END=713 /DNA_ORIENTATION=-